MPPLNKAKYIKEAFAKMPHVPSFLLESSSRYDVIRELRGTANVGIELGVAEGWFSSKLVRSGKFAKLFGVDVYGDSHDSAEYFRALKCVGLEENYKLLRMTFDEAIGLFPDEFFDFIYVDGFAHTGEEGGSTLSKWYKKLKVGGTIAGDDYHADWPLVMWAVNHFAAQLKSQLILTEACGLDSYSKYPSWMLIKHSESDAITLTLDERLVAISQKEKKRIFKRRTSRLTRFRKAVSSKIKEVWP